MIISHSGPLTTSSLDHCLPAALFRPASNPRTKKAKGDADPYHMGWEYVPSGNSYEFRLSDLPFATAEGVVTLAALIDCLRRKPNGEVHFEISEKANNWSNGLQLGQLIKGHWLTLNRFPSKFSRPSGCYTFPLWREVVTDRSSSHSISEQLATQIELILQDLKHSSPSDVAFAAKLLFDEALLNVFEHAYAQDEDKVAFGAITVTPVPRGDQLRKLAYVTKEEAEWFSQFSGSGLMLEVAVADFGSNIPFTLWRAFKNEFPRHFAKYESLRLGSHTGRLQRAQLHHEILIWAFNHRSTRKGRNDFSSELAFLNWRGLHRAMNTAARLSGCMVIRSGQARTGFAFYGDASLQLAPTTSKQHEFPGTSITLRIPIPRTKQRAVIAKVEDDRNQGNVIRIEEALNTSTVDSIKAEDYAGRVAFLGVAHAFKTFATEEVIRLVETTLSMPPHIIPIYFFADVEPITALSQLSAFHESKLGPPRLVAFWKADQRLLWRFVGVIPSTARAMIEGLEENGTSSIGTDRANQIFAENLARSYSPYIEIERGTISLLPFKAHVSSISVHDALQRGFELWAADGDGEWRFNEPRKYIRLMTGRLIKQYISVFKLLDSDEFLAREVGRTFTSVLSNLQHDHPNLCIVTDSEASYFIARMLLQDHRPSPDIHIGSSPKRDVSARPSVVFIDAIQKGDTLKSLVRKTKGLQAIICCLDLRPEKRPQADSPLPIKHRLLRYPFDPQEVAEDTITENDIVLEVDAVTHIPEEGAQLEVLSLGTTPHREQFILAHPELFQYGYQRRTGRIDVIRLSVAALIAEHAQSLLDWIVGVIGAQLKKQPLHNERLDLVIFVRTEAIIQKIVPELAQRLRSEFGFERVLKALLPSVSSSAGELFGRPTPELFYGLEQVEGQRELFGRQPTTFIALYLDDASVTGKSLLNFLNRVSLARADQLPSLILAIPIVCRLSPAEEIFFGDVCKRITARHEPTRKIPFSLAHLFRLQVRSFDIIESTPAYQLILRLASNDSWFDPRLLTYVEALKNNIRSLASPTREAIANEGLSRHPFYAGVQYDDEPPSARVIRIRHLIALQEQNLGVLSVLLHELLEVFKVKDFGLLTMLALEPSLIEMRPLSKGARHDITRLAMDAILGESSAGLKSDALCVLALQGQVLIDRLPELLPKVGADDDLIDQLLVFLFASKTLGSMWYGNVGGALRECASQLSPETYSYLQSWLQSFDEITSQRPVLTAHDARQAIANLIAQTSYHGKGLDKLNALGDWVFSRETERSLRDGLAVKRIVHDVYEFLRDVVLLGIDGLNWWAEFRGNNPMAAAVLSRSYDQLIPLLNQLIICSNGLTSGPVGPSVAKKIEDLWKSIRSLSLTSQADTFLSREPDLPMDEMPILERWGPQFFCLPLEILYGLASFVLQHVEVRADWELPEQAKVVVVVPFPLSPIERVFSLILQDMRSHGTKTDDRIDCSINHKDGVSELNVVFQNRVRKRNVARSGASQKLARNIAHQYGFEVQPDPPAQPGAIYRVRVTLPNSMYLQWT